MIAKIVKGKDFRGVVNYILDEKKQTEILDSEGLRTRNKETIIHSFFGQAQLNQRLGKSVYHISLSFSPKDKKLLSNEVMVRVAREYMESMKICNTQYLIARHSDKAHPHLHMIINRVDYHGKTISDRNDRLRSEKICKEITRKYGFYFGKGKELVNQKRLHGSDKIKYEIYNALKKQVPESRNWKELEKRLEEQGILVEFKTRGKTSVVQGVIFIKDKISFNGSKIDAQLRSKVGKQKFLKPKEELGAYEFLRELLYQSSREEQKEELQVKRKRRSKNKSGKKGLKR